VRADRSCALQATVAVAVASLLAACPARRTFDRSDLLDGGDGGATEGDGGAAAPSDAAAPEDGAAPDADAAYSGPYPVGPYGTAVGSTVADHTFLGWARHDAAQTSVLALHDVYDPTGLRARLLVLIVTGGWCGGPCSQLPFDAVRWSGDAGRSDVVTATVMVRGADPAVPARDAETRTLATQVGAPFFVGRDPAAELATYVDLDVMPALLFVDTRTMKLVRVTVGVPQDLGAEIRAALQ